MPTTAKVFEDKEWHGHWQVEWLDDDGKCEITIFSGPNAYARAIRYANTSISGFRAHVAPPAERDRFACQNRAWGTRALGGQVAAPYRRSSRGAFNTA